MLKEMFICLNDDFCQCSSILIHSKPAHPPKFLRHCVNVLRCLCCSLELAFTSFHVKLAQLTTNCKISEKKRI